MGYHADRIDAALDAANGTGGSAVAWAVLHTDAPGGSGTNAQAQEAAPAAISMSAASSGESVGEAEFTIEAAEGPYTHVSLWTNSGGSPDVFVGSGALTPQEEFAGAGTLKVTVTTTASST